MKKRTVHIVVYYRWSGNCYTREAVSDKGLEAMGGYKGVFTHFEIQSDENLQTINETWFAEVNTTHPTLVDWSQPEFPVMAGCLKVGRERSK